MEPESDESESKEQNRVHQNHSAKPIQPMLGHHFTGDQVSQDDPTVVEHHRQVHSDRGTILD